FYPIFQLVDYGLHGWDIRQGAGVNHGLSGDTADLLVPLNFIVWSATHNCGPATEPFEIGIRVTGRNGGDTRMKVGPEGVAFELERIAGAEVERQVGVAVDRDGPACVAGTWYQVVNLGRQQRAVGVWVV